MTILRNFGSIEQALAHSLKHLKEEEVKTLPKDIFQKVDTMAAPRLVEYWEIDPCRKYEALMDFSADSAPPSASFSRWRSSFLADGSFLTYR